jgi:hypothetical protein
MRRLGRPKSPFHPAAPSPPSRVYMNMSGLWLFEDGMRSNSTPDNMLVSFSNLSTIVESGSSIWCPGHLPDATSPLDSFDPESGVEVTLSQSFDKQMHSSKKGSLLIGQQAAELATKALHALKCRHSGTRCS